MALFGMYTSLLLIFVPDNGTDADRLPQFMRADQAYKFGFTTMGEQLRESSIKEMPRDFGGCRRGAHSPLDRRMRAVFATKSLQATSNFPLTVITQTVSASQCVRQMWFRSPTQSFQVLPFGVQLRGKNSPIAVYFIYIQNDGFLQFFLL